MCDAYYKGLFPSIRQSITDEERATLLVSVRICESEGEVFVRINDNELGLAGFL
jgi:hypothetical protein